MCTNDINAQNLLGKCLFFFWSYDTYNIQATNKHKNFGCNAWDHVQNRDYPDRIIPNNDLPLLNYCIPNINIQSPFKQFQNKKTNQEW